MTMLAKAAVATAMALVLGGCRGYCVTQGTILAANSIEQTAKANQCPSTDIYEQTECVCDSYKDLGDKWGTFTATCSKEMKPEWVTEIQTISDELQKFNCTTPTPAPAEVELAAPAEQAEVEVVAVKQDSLFLAAQAFAKAQDQERVGFMYAF